MHELATGSLDINTDGVVYSAHSSAYYYQFQLGTMIGLDQQSKGYCHVKRLSLQSLNVTIPFRRLQLFAFWTPPIFYYGQPFVYLQVISFKKAD